MLSFVCIAGYGDDLLPFEEWPGVVMCEIRCVPHYACLALLKSSGENILPTLFVMQAKPDSIT
jgi:hypothetical protein